MANYLVTGAAGFIGGAIGRRLVAEGHRVVTIDNLSTGSRDSVPEGVELIVGNCQDQHVIDELGGTTFDAILHVAGQSSGEISFDDPVYDLQTNTQSTLLLLQYAVSVGCRDFVYASSMSVYGEQAQQPVGEDATLAPKSFYAVGKSASEHYLQIYERNYDIRTTSLRLFNVYGPGQNMGNLRQGMVSIFLAYALREESIHVKGSPDRYRDFVYIDDVVDAFLATMRASSDGYAAYNIASGEMTTVAELIEQITGSLPYDVRTFFEGTTPGDMFGIYADVSRVRQALGWSPRVPLSEGLARMIDWATGLDQAQAS